MPQLTTSRLRQGETLRLEQLYFEADSTDITAESRPVLDEVYEFLDENPSVVIEVRGHTNGIPEHDFCDRLSDARARSVAGYITSKGIDPKRVAYKGYGKRKPIASNKTPEGRQKNQRVEIKILDFEAG